MEQQSTTEQSKLSRMEAAREKLRLAFEAQSGPEPACGGKTLLVTGFDPFGGETVNPAWETVRRLPDRIGGYDVFRLQVPTVFGKAAQTVIREAERVKPDVIVCVGQAGGRASVTPELFGVNLRHARIPDNEGNRPEHEEIIPGGEDVLQTALPLRRMLSAAEREDCRCALSFDAGLFVCNELLYSLLSRFRGTGVKAGFIHVPFLPEQAKGKPSLPADEMLKTLTALLKGL